MNECKSNTHGCDQICINAIGGYNCECEFGFSLNDVDRRGCEKGIDEIISELYLSMKKHHFIYLQNIDELVLTFI